MKKILFILSLLVIITSCSVPTIQKEEELPMSVIFKKEHQKYDTILTISTYNDTKTVLFTKKEKYIGTITNDNDDFGNGICLGILITLFLLCWIVIIIDNN